MTAKIPIQLPQHEDNWRVVWGGQLTTPSEPRSWVVIRTRPLPSKVGGKNSVLFGAHDPCVARISRFGGSMETLPLNLGRGIVGRLRVSGGLFRRLLRGWRRVLFPAQSVSAIPPFTSEWVRFREEHRAGQNYRIRSLHTIDRFDWQQPIRHLSHRHRSRPGTLSRFDHDD